MKLLHLSLCILLALQLEGCSKSTEDWIKEGRAALESKDVDKAIITLKNAIQQAPESIPARIALGEAYERGGYLGDAEQQYVRALELGGDSNQLTPRIAVLSLDNNEPAKILRDFGKTALSDPAADSNLRATLATAAMADRKLAEAKRFLSEVKQTTDAVRLAKAQLDLLEGRRTEAFNAADELSKSASLPWNVWRGIGRLYALQGNNEKTLFAFKKALEALPGHPELQAALAEAYLSDRKLEEGKKLRDQLVKTAPKHYRTMFIDAYLKLQEGRIEEAHTQALRVLSVMPEHFPALVIASKIELTRGELASAENHARKAIKLRDTSVEPYRILAEALLQQRNVSEAKAWTKRGLVLAPQDSSLLILDAEMLWADKQTEAAIAALDKVRNSSDDKIRAPATVRLAEMRFAAGQKQQALETLGEAEKLAGKDAGLRERIFQIALRAGETAHAQRMADEELKANPNNPAIQMWFASIAGSQGKTAEAINYTRKALDLQADYYPALLALRATARSTEEKAEVIARLDKAIAAGTKNPQIYLDTVIMLRATAAAPDKIAAVFEKGIVAVPESVALRETAINHFLSLNQGSKAVPIAQTGVEADPDSPAMTALLSSTLDATGDHQQAAKLLNQLVSRYPDQASLRIRLAESQAKAGQTAEATETLKKAVAHFPDDLQVHTTLAALQVQQGRFDDALTTISILRDKKAWSQQGYIMQGDVFTQTKRYDEALKSYAKAAEAGAVGPAQLRRVNVLDKTSDSLKGDKELQAWIRAHPDDGTALQFAAQRAMTRNDYKSAVSYLQQLNQLAPGQASVLNDLAWAQLQSGDTESSLKNARAAYALSPEAPAIVDTLGLALIKAKQQEEGFKMLRKAATLAPQSAEIKLNLAEQLVMSGEKSEARKLLAEMEQGKLSRPSQEKYRALEAKLK